MTPKRLSNFWCFRCDLNQGRFGFYFFLKRKSYLRGWSKAQGLKFRLVQAQSQIVVKPLKRARLWSVRTRFSHAGLRTKQNMEETLCALDHTFDMLLKRFSRVFHMYIKFTSKRRGHALSCTFCSCLKWICGSLSRTSLWILRNSLWWASGLVPEQGGLRFHSSRGTHKFSCFPCSWCDQKHISLIHYRAQNLTPFLILLMW